MNTIDLTPLYRSSVGFDRLGALLDSALTTDNSVNGYPPYNIQVLEENKYLITLAVAGFSQDDLSIQVEQGVLTIRGRKDQEDEQTYLHRGIANRSFERKFNLADFIEVTDATMNDGLLQISLIKEIPEAMKPKTIAISSAKNSLGHDSKGSKEDKK